MRPTMKNLPTIPNRIAPQTFDPRPFAAACLMVWATTSGCAKIPASDEPGTAVTSTNVIVIVSDTMRADHLGLYGYPEPTSPFIDTLGDRALVYENAYSHFSFTWPTISNLFTGKKYSALVRDHEFVSPKEFTEPGLVPENLTLAERLTAAGVRSFGVSANPYVNKGTGFGQGFDEFHDVYDWDPDFWHGAIHKYTVEEVNEVAFDQLDRLANGTGPWFLYLHYFDAHMPYRAPAELRAIFEDPTYSRTGRVVDGYFRRPDGDYLSYLTEDMKEWMSPEDLDYLVAQYDAEVRYFDHGIGRLFAYLDDHGLRSSTTVILLADHGEAFMERAFWGHGFLSRAEEERVPMIVVGPNVRRRRIDVPVTTSDVFHSVLAHFGVRLEDSEAEDLVPWQADLLSGETKGRVAYTEGPGNTQVFRSSQYSLYRYHSIESTGRPIPVQNGDFLFDLTADRGERSNLFDNRADLAGEVRDRLLELSRLNSLTAPSAGAEDPLKNSDDETKRRLKALGYIQ